MAETGNILGHEFMGIVEDVGKAVISVKRGDRVVIPFTIACGECFFCNRALVAACETTNPGRARSSTRSRPVPAPRCSAIAISMAAFAVARRSSCAAPRANVGPLLIPDSTLSDEQVLFLSDILPTGYQAAINAGVERGSTVATFGAGPVGLMAAASCRLLGAERIFMVDHHQYRLDYAAETYEVEPINFDKEDDPADIIIERTDRRGVDCTIDAVGFEAKGSTSRPS
jgi:threonine dehydrogenase-like Zn-dependent dehydrogenase